MRNSFKLAAVLLFIAISGTVLWSVFLEENHDFVISITAFALGLVTFFGIANLRPAAPQENVFRGENLRTAIACSLLISYLFIVCLTAFVRTADVTGGVTQEFVKSFSNVIGITIAFYFGASAVAQIFAPGKSDPSDRKKSEHDG